MPPRLCQVGQNRFGLGKNFLWDEGARIMVKFFWNNRRTRVQTVTEEEAHPMFCFPLSSLLMLVSTTIILWQDQSVLLWQCRREVHKIKKIQSLIKLDEHTHLRWCEQLIKHTFSLSMPANLETRCMLEIGDISWKFQFDCSCQFLWSAPTLYLCVQWGQQVDFNSGEMVLVLINAMLN
jgi:hypothetical protein